MLQMTHYITRKSKINNLKKRHWVQTCGMLRSKLREMAPDPQPTSRHRKSVVCDSPRINRRSSRTRLTSSYTHTNQQVQMEINVFKHTVSVYPKSHVYLKSWKSSLLQKRHVLTRSLKFFTSVSGRGMNTGGFIFRVRSLKSHSSITYCTGILKKTHIDKGQ